MKKSAQPGAAPTRSTGPEIPVLAQELGARFAEAGHTLALVGGSVRDLVIRRPINDLDFTTDARPDRIEEILTGWAEATWDMGRAYGTIGGRRRG
ncbi:MAG: CCA tRNA nucleotidyltransferase, partial [Angustibacter sp.]